MRRSVLSPLIALFTLGLAVGCANDPNARQAVSGTVYFQGQPLDQGSIHFIPIERLPSESGAGIENGAYTVPRDRGLVPGKYKVVIASYDRTGPKVQSDEMPGEPSAKQFKERIPAKYNHKTMLTAEVKGNGKNVFDFKLD